MKDALVELHKQLEEMQTAQRVLVNDTPSTGGEHPLVCLVSPHPRPLRPSFVRVCPAADAVEPSSDCGRRPELAPRGRRTDARQGG